MRWIGLTVPSLNQEWQQLIHSKSAAGIQGRLYMTECPTDVPTILTDLKQWVCWKAVERDGRITKMPIKATTGEPAKSNDPATWTDFESACDGAVGLGASGIGFCFSEDDGLVGIDLDVCFKPDKKTLEEWALVILHKFSSYAEISPSGRGLKIWCRGKIPKGYKINLGEKDPTINKAPGLEVYTTGRYFTVTGDRWEGLPQADVVEAQAAIDWLVNKYWPAAGPAVVQTTEIQAATYTQATSGQELSVQERAARYLAKMPSAVDGEHGHDKTFHAACVCMLGFGMSVDEAWPVIAEWNQGCLPPWSDADLRRKLDEANKQGGARGCLLTGRSYDGPDVDLRAIFNSIEVAEGPQIVSASDLIKRNPNLAPVLVEGLLRRGETANIIAPPKCGKSWLTYGLALSVTTGRPWLDRYKTFQGRVLLIDNELHGETLAHRIPLVAAEMGITEGEYAQHLDVLSLRGNLMHLEELASVLKQRERGYYSLIIIDAWYRMIPVGVSENDNAGMTQLYNLIDQHAAATDSGWCLVHHASKGSQTDKSVTDVGAGAGSQSRAADAHIVLREHADENHAVLDAAVRSFPPLESVTLRWEFPLWYPTDVSPRRLADAQQRKQKARDAEGIGQISKELENSNDWQSTRAIRGLTGIGADRCTRLLNLMIEQRQVESRDVKTNGKDSREYQLSAHARSIKDFVERSSGSDHIIDRQTTAV
jgi:hypothetical protein